MPRDNNGGHTPKATVDSSLDNNATVKTTLITSKYEKEKWIKYAEAQNRSLSSFIRNAVDIYILAYENKMKKKREQEESKWR